MTGQQVKNRGGVFTHNGGNKIISPPPKKTNTHTVSINEWHGMTRMTGSDCAVMCKINKHTHTHTVVQYNASKYYIASPVQPGGSVHCSALIDRKDRKDRKVHYTIIHDSALLYIKHHTNHNIFTANIPGVELHVHEVPVHVAPEERTSHQVRDAQFFHL